uniref:G-protein coupled receptors family 3 profile domain-containing protein n=1 Tax=Odontella aurita TaxID=265563 RepID=A0A7S4K3F0_9STRA
MSGSPSSSSSSLSWGYFDRVRERHVKASSPPSDVYRVPAGDGAVDLRHLVVISPQLVGDGDTPYQAYVDLAGAALLALHHINNGGGSDAIPELTEIEERCGRTRFTADFIDSRISPIASSRALLKDVLRRHETQADSNEFVSKSGGDSAGSRAPVATAVIGAYRSVVSVPLATLGGVYVLPQFSLMSTSTSLDNRDNFPYFGRIIPSVAADAAVVVDYLDNVVDEHVTHFGVLHIKDEYGTSYAQAVERAARAAGMSVTVVSLPLRRDKDSDPEVRRAAVRKLISQLKSTGMRYFLGIFFYEDYEPVMLEALEQGIAGSGNFWVFSDSLFDLAHASFNTSMKNGRDLIEVSRGTALLAFTEAHILKGEPRYDALLRHWSNAYITKGNHSLPEGRQHFNEKMRLAWGKVVPDKERVEKLLGDYTFSDYPSTYSILAYNTVIAAAFAVCDAESKERDSHTNSISIGSNSEMEASIVENLFGKDVYDSFVNTTFMGTFGDVSIDPKTGSGEYHTMQNSVSNLLPEKEDATGMVRVHLHSTHVRRALVNSADAESADDKGGASADPASITYSWRTLQNFIYSDGTTTAPPSLPPVQHDPQLTSQGYLAAGYLLCAMVVLTSLVCCGWTYWHHERRVIKASQPIFLYILASGALLMGMAIIPLGMQEGPSAGQAELDAATQASLDAACGAIPWLITVGFSLTFSALFAKEIRIAKLMLKKDMRRMQVSAAHVMKPALVLVGLNAIIMAVWTGVAPFSYKRLNTEGIVDKYGRPTQSIGMCVLPPDPNGDPNGVWWVGVMFLCLVAVMNVTALFLALRQVYLTRSIQTEFSESKFITLSMVSIAQAFLCGTPMIVLGFSEGPATMFLLVSILVFIVCQSILTFIFLPKVYFLREANKREEWREKERSRKAKTPNWAKPAQHILDSKPDGPMGLAASSAPMTSMCNLPTKVTSKRIMVDGNVVDACPAGGGGTGAGSGRNQLHQLSELQEESDERCFDDEILGATITASSMMAFSLTKHDGDSSVVKESDDDNTKDPRGAHPPRQVSLLSMGESFLGL